MARRGRFGRSETGASDLSATIRSLVQQQLAMEEQMLFKAFYEGVPFGGSIPNYSDLVNFVQERLGGGEASDAQVAYYDALLKQAEQFKIQETYKGLKESFYSTNGANYEEVADFLQGEGSDFGSDLYEITKDYITGYLVQDLQKDSITREEFLSKANKATTYFADNPFVYDDVKYSVYDTLFAYDSNEQSDLLQRVNPNKPKKVLAANQQLLEFYRGWRATLNENGIAGDLLDTVQNNLSQTKFAIQKQKQDIANAAAAALLAGRKNSYEASQATLDEYARQIAPSLGIDASDPNFSFSDIPPVTMAAALMELPPAAQDQVRGAINDLNNKSVAYAQTLRAQGDIAEARSVRAVATQTKLLSGEDVSFERYVAASEQKDALMAIADGMPSDEIYITQEWVKFLKGENSAVFGAGITPGSDLAGQEIKRNVLAEAAAFEAVLNGQRPSIVPKTWMDDYQAAERGQIGLSNSVSDFNGTEYSGDNKYTAAELSNLETTINFDKKISAGEMVLQKTANPDGTTRTSYIEAGVPSPAAGLLYRIEQSATGKNVTVAYQGTPIYGASAGNVDKNQKWGYVYNTKSGDLYVDAKTGTVYKQPPIDVSKLRVSGGLAANGENALITSDIVPKTDTNGYTFVESIRQGQPSVEASITDYVEPAALQSLQSPGINPYARVSPSDTRIQGATGNVVNLKNIAASIPDGSAGKAQLLIDINNIEKNLNSLIGRSEDSGVRIAQMNADLAKQAAATAAKTKLPSVTPTNVQPSPLSRVPSAADAAAAERVSSVLGEGAQGILGGANVFFRELGKIGGAIGQAGLMAGGALATGVPSLVGGAVSAGVNFLLPGIPGTGGAGGTSGGVKPLAPVGGVKPLFTAPKPISGAGLTLTAQPFVEFRAGERASLTAPISTTPKTTAPRFSTPTTGRIAL